jgi:hypothetical protein
MFARAFLLRKPLISGEVSSEFSSENVNHAADGRKVLQDCQGDSLSNGGSQKCGIYRRDSSVGLTTQIRIRGSGARVPSAGWKNEYLAHGK